MSRLTLLAVALLLFLSVTDAGFLKSSSYNSQPTKKELFDAFLEGADLDNLVPNSTDCVHDLEFGYEDVYEAVNHIMVRGYTWENHLDFMGAIGSLTPIVTTCYNVSEDSIEMSKDHFGKFESFIDFATKAAYNAQSKLFDWIDVYTEISSAITRNKPKEVSYQIGRSVTLLLAFPVKSQGLNSDRSVGPDLPDLNPYIDFLEGFLNGTQLLSSNRISNCVNESNFIVDSVTNATLAFKGRSDENFKAGVFELAEIFEHLRPFNEECYYGFTDAEKIFFKYMKTFKSPTDIAINAMRHFNEIYDDSLSFIQHVHNKEWTKSGKDLGDVFFNIFFTQ